MKKNEKMDFHQDGVDAAFAGKEEEDCPTTDDDDKSSWLGGFKAAITTILRTNTGKKDDD